jgi:hypothetical protein
MKPMVLVFLIADYGHREPPTDSPQSQGSRGWEVSAHLRLSDTRSTRPRRGGRVRGVASGA